MKNNSASKYLLSILVIVFTFILFYRNDIKQFYNSFHKRELSITPLGEDIFKSDLSENKIYPIKELVILDDCNFEIILKETDIRYLVRLNVSYPPSSKDEIIEYLNQADKAEIQILNKKTYVAKIIVYIRDEPVNLEEWLIKERLAYGNRR